MLKPTKILVPVDFSEFSAKAVQYGSEFAKTFDAELILGHVLEIPTYPMGMGMEAAAPMYISADVTPVVEERLDKLMKEHVAKGVKVRRWVRESTTPFLEIIQMAKDEDVDLIIMPTHGRTGLSHLIIGSTAERVVRQAPCPVLVVRQHEKDIVA